MIHTLEADGIQLSFSERKILSDVYFKCETGKITGLLGRNGQGKSCLMNIVYGTLAVDIKSVRFDGQYAGKPYLRPDLLSYLPQFHIIPASLSVARVLGDFELDFHEFEKIFTGFEQASAKKMSELSGGQRRLMELYVIIRSKSLFAMLDEPFSHISPVQTDQIKELIMHEKQHKGFFITDHMHRHIMDISDYLYVLAGGKVHLTSSEQDVEDLGYAKF